VHAARHVAEHPEHAERLEEIYAMLDERVSYLREFLEGYAKFARLPHPQKREVPWEELLRGVRAVCEFRLEGNVPSTPGWFDPAQLQQVLINLIKNAHEAGSAEVVVVIQSSVLSGTVMRVCDRGSGMSEEEMRQALVPFYSSKRTGTGLGVPLCNEIIEAHGGRMRISAREGGGIEVTCWLPPPEV
jgi:nitrogen fixation/metabolism regulation signal transduction histidine kinase